MRTMLHLVLIAGFILVGAILGGCDSLEPSNFESEVVVNAFFESGERLPSIRINRTISIDGTFDPDETAVRDATVEVQLLGADGSVEETYPYAYQANSPGLYWRTCDDCGSVILEPSPDPIVIPLRTYRLLAEVPGELSPIVATTTVPDTMSVTYASADSIVYQSSESFTFHISEPSSPGRQSVFVFSTLALDGHEHQLTPFAKSLVENSDDVTVADLREGLSPILNEENFERQPDGTLRVRFPWLGINFYGRNRISMIALDENLYDFVRSQTTQQGGSTRPPGEIPNVLEHVDGGRGVVGSYAKASVDFYVLR